MGVGLGVLDVGCGGVFADVAAVVVVIVAVTAVLKTTNRRRWECIESIFLLEKREQNISSFHKL